MKQSKFDNYQLCALPIGSAYFEMSTQVARDNYNRFMHIIPERTNYLVTHCANDLQISTKMFDLSPKSLVLIWKWFLQNACIVDKGEHEKIELRKHFEHLGESFIGKKRLSAVTEFVLQDIGIYLGESFVHNCHSVSWELCLKPKNSIFINRPVLVGFVDNNYTPPFHAVFEPIHMVGVQAAKLLSENSSDEKDLYNLYMQWKKYTAD